MALTDRELMLLEQLTYLTEDVYEAAGVDYVDIKEVKGRTIGKVLKDFTEKELITLSESEEELSAKVSGREWAGIIRRLQTDPKLRELEIKDTLEINVGEGFNKRKAIVGLAFEDPATPNVGIVAFKGTTGSKEWEDNALGIYLADTPSQKLALSFVEKLPYKDITVTGHSKGGNKAMYVTVLSDKVTRCVSLDGQGFGKAFYDKYWASVRAKAHLISNHSLSLDFVHIQLYPIPGSIQRYYQGQNIGDFLEHHSPNSFFKTDADGNLLLKNGEVVLLPEGESTLMRRLHEFSNFVMNNTTEQQQREMGQCVGEILVLLMDDNQLSDKEMAQIYTDNRETLILMAAAFIKYAQTDTLSRQLRNDMLNSLQIGYIIPLVEIYYAMPSNPLAEFTASTLIEFIKQPLFFGHELWSRLASYFGYKDTQDMIDLWRALDQAVVAFPTDGGIKEIEVREDRTYDFSVQTYQTLMDVIAKIEENALPSMDTWHNYQTESWFEALFINNAVNAVHHYGERLSEINRLSRERIDAIFEDVRAIDGRYAGKLRESNARLRQINRDITELSRAIG